MIISHHHLLTLSGIKGFGPKKIHAVAEYIQNERSVELSDREMCDIIHEMILKKALKGVKDFFSSDFMNAAENAKRVMEKSLMNGISMTSRYEESFPKSLLNTVNEDGKESIPLLLFYKGNLGIANNKSVAIIGTRDPSPEGIMASAHFAKELAEKGVNIVSGLALGCDTAAHKGAIEVQGHTTAVLGNGLNKMYPPENIELADRIVASGGLLISEYPVDSDASPYSLVARDRLQAALSQSVLVIQTSIKGGTMHAVNAASHVHKPIFAVSYKKILSPEFFSGNQLLIQQGKAKPISSSPEDVNRILGSLYLSERVLPEGTQLSIF